MNNDLFLLVIALSVLGPVIGSFIGVYRKPTEGFMFNMLSFAAGVMLSVSFLQLIPESIGISTIWITLIGILLGAVFMFLLDVAIPHIHPSLCSQEHGGALNKTVNYLTMGIFLHHFPEGMAIGIGMVSGMVGDNQMSGLAIALAIAIHDVPESICTSGPYYYLSGKKFKSFLVSCLTAVPTLVGFLLTYYLYQTIPSGVFGLLIAATAGLMIYVSADELIPATCSMERGHGGIFSLILGVLLVVLISTP